MVEHSKASLEWLLIALLTHLKGGTWSWAASTNRDFKSNSPLYGLPLESLSPCLKNESGGEWGGNAQ